MQIPAKRAGVKKKPSRKPKYSFAKLLRTGVQNILGDPAHSQLMKANARYFAKKNGLTITTRLHSLGIKIYLVKRED